MDDDDVANGRGFGSGRVPAGHSNTLPIAIETNGRASDALPARFAVRAGRSNLRGCMPLCSVPETRWSVRVEDLSAPVSRRTYDTQWYKFPP
jgi:hypothetical protein